MRFAPEAAWALSLAGEALIVDLRSSDERRRDGIVPGSLHVPRTVLEWRVDQESGWSNPELDGRERRLILLCAHGYSSSLAAATLVDLGHREAGDVEGGVAAGAMPGSHSRPRPSRSRACSPAWPLRTGREAIVLPSPRPAASID